MWKFCFNKFSHCFSLKILDIESYGLLKRWKQNNASLNTIEEKYKLIKSKIDKNLKILNQKTCGKAFSCKADGTEFNWTSLFESKKINSYQV